ncbi:MAG TPA: 30S ribosomal protein S12 methylthiotransferase RimO [Dissulfurispiraceae bacterium]|nr:30S ribosomal protein S12 methylthiotransferase RimO [Dissulfurispiraceae bacterium]
MPKIHITTLGCPKNVADSRHLEESFADEGLVRVADPRDADVLLVNTCGFIKEAKEESVEEILRLSQVKETPGNSARSTEEPGPRRLVVFGCLAQRYRDELLREIPEIDGIWGVGQEREIIDYCKAVDVPDHAVRSLRPQAAVSEFAAPDFRPPTTSFAYLKIAEGCDKKCTFCVIPSIRGPFRSLKPETILLDAESLLSAGARELVLVAQDITSYGRDLGDYRLTSLLRDLTSLSGEFWVRLMYLYPAALDEPLIELIASNNKIVKYLDIPLQHSEDRMLRLMGRRGTRKEYTKLIRTARRLIPGVALRTSLIAGFPTETEEEFNGLVDFMEEIRFDRLGVFRYSREEGTPAWSLKGQIPDKVKERRLHEIMTRQASISLEKNKDLIGRRLRALVDEADGDVLLARLETHAPEIDGMVIVERSGRDSEVRAGRFVTVEIMNAYDYDLKGVIVYD